MSGLINPKNLCYLNSILQCLVYIDDFRKWLLNKENSEVKRTILTMRLSILFDTLCDDNGNVSSEDIKTMIGNLHNKFQNDDQQDSHELLTELLDDIHNEVSKKIQIKFQQIPNDVIAYMIFIEFEAMPKKVKEYKTAIKNGLINENHDNDIIEIYNSYENWMNNASTYMKEKRDIVTIANGYMFWKEFVEKSNSIITRLFTGLLYLRIECDECHNITDSFSSFINLTLPVNESENMTLIEMLEEFTCDTKLYGNNQYMCAPCGKKVNATQKTCIWELPKVLIIHLKRFNYDKKTSNSNKISTQLFLPVDNLDMKPYMSSLCAEQPSKYNLSSTNNHHGSTIENGHYTSFCRSTNQNSWYEYDDTTVTNISNKEISERLVTGEPYILFYVKQ
jgi:ubiquitin C-terminal hydrolase